MKANKALQNKAENANNSPSASIGLRSFITVISILSALLFISGFLSYVIPQGHFLRDESGAILPESFSQGEIGSA